MTKPPGLQPSQAPRRRRSWPRGHKRLTAGIAAFGLLLVIGAIATAAGAAVIVIAGPLVNRYLGALMLSKARRRVSDAPQGGARTHDHGSFR